MSDEFIRTKLVIGNENFEKLKTKKIAIFGIGGVGSYVVEALARMGIENFLLVDNDKVSTSNINRQIIALHSSVGRLKVEVMKERILDINPNAKVEIKDTFFLPENSNEFDFSNYDYIIDAIDTVTGKIELVLKAQRENVKIISSMGTGNKIEPSKFKITDIYKTNVCPLAKVMRKELKNRGVKKLKVLYSEELPIKLEEKVLKECDDNDSRRSVPGSLSFVPSVAGLMIAGEVVRDLIN